MIVDSFKFGLDRGPDKLDLLLSAGMLITRKISKFTSPELSNERYLKGQLLCSNLSERKRVETMQILCENGTCDTI